MISKFKSFFALEDEYEYKEEIVEEKEVEQKPVKATNMKKQTSPQGGGQNVVSIQSLQKSSKVVLLEPRVYSDSQEIADHLKNKKAVVVNLQRISHDQAKRIVDFLSGTVYAIGGDISKIGPNIFLCTPDNVDVTGTITGVGYEEEYEDSRW
ncbi:cell division protein SepF [Peribacillus alkalitolerans]|uniref:cell division protein SepF n=1 Tax=Peribacillus alkalitolerans TaxID=1550385 RepID=UPI0013D4707A|nr:cell division protein SepF [Peribacillus alkalitolerans]